MLDIQFIRDNTELVRKAIADKQSKVDLDLLLDIDRKRRDLLGRSE